MLLPAMLLLLPNPASNTVLVDRAWLWTHPTGFHDNYFTHAPFISAAPGTYRSRITPTEAALYMGLRSALFVYEEQASYTLCQRGDNTTGSYPCYPTTQAELPKYMLPFESSYFQQTAFSISGGGVSYPDNYTDAVIAAMPSTSVGVIYDDFAFDECHLELLQNMSRRMDALGGKDVFLVVYAFELAAMGPVGLKPFLAAATRPMLWFKNRTELADLEQHWAAFEAAIAHAGGRPKKPMLGLYMFDYLTHHAAGAQEMPEALMTAQLNVALQLLHAGRVHDVIFLGSPIVDLPLAAVQQTRAWLAKHGQETISPPPLPAPSAAVTGRSAPHLQSTPRVTVYEAGEENYTQFRIPVLLSLPSTPPTPAAGCVAGPGVVLAFAEGRGRNHTSANDWGNVHIVMKKSVTPPNTHTHPPHTPFPPRAWMAGSALAPHASPPFRVRQADGGVSWDKLVVVADNAWDNGATTADKANNTWVGNPSPLYDKATGRITLVFTSMNREVHSTVSTSDGETWSAPRNITSSVKRPEWSRLSGSTFTGPGGALVLQHGAARGRMVVPCIFQTDNTSFLFSNRTQWDLGTMNSVIISDDAGEHWRLGGTIPAGVPGCRASNLTTRECGDEMQVAEVMWPAEGLLVAVIRDPGHPAMTFSSDGGLTFTAPVLASGVCVPSSQISLMSLGANRFWHGALLMAAPWGPELGVRGNMTVSVSPSMNATPTDGWTAMLALDSDPTAYGGYSSLTALAHQNSDFGILWESCSGNTCLAFAKLSLVH